MNIPTPVLPTPDPELLRKLVEEFQPNPHRVPFRNLEPFRESIGILRVKGASYAVITDLLRQHGVKTSRARVAEYGRTVLDKQKLRKRRRHPNTIPPGTPIATLQALTSLPPPVNAPSSVVSSDQRPRGPRIAKVRMLDGTTT